MNLHQYLHDGRCHCKQTNQQPPTKHNIFGRTVRPDKRKRRLW
jgi:hypothetical protein